MRPTKGEEKLTVRLSEQELKAIDAYVHAGGYRTRSDFVRTAIEQYLSYNLETLTRPPPSPEEVRVRLKEHEIDLLTRYVELVANGNLADTLAALVRHGMSIVKPHEVVRNSEAILEEARGRSRSVTLNRAPIESESSEPRRTAERRQTKRGGWSNGY